jgi:hypothetical protein
VAYAASLERLFGVLHTRAPSKVEALATVKRGVSHGLLSVGLKLHCLRQGELFTPLIDALGGKDRVLDRNLFRRADAQFCLVLPPIGSARAAILLLEAIGQFTGCSLFNNPNIQLQVCSPGRLGRRSAALHAIGFYLSSDTLRQYSLDDFATTVSADYYQRGKRLVIYDAGLNGDFDPAFEWWGRGAAGLTVRPSLPFLNGRTDIIVGPGSRVDIENINLLATLLVHGESIGGDGYWSSLGELFARDLLALLDRHLLAGLIEAPWISGTDWEGSAKDDQLFLSALQELMAYAAEEAKRLPRASEADSQACILREMQQLIATYRSIVTSIASEADRCAS